MEIWKDIQGFEGKYQVSTKGNVRNRYKILAPKKHNKGYFQIELSNGIKGQSKTFLVHRLVAETFIENPNNYKIVNHIDENKQNNNIENLEWCTQNHNMKCYYSNHKTKENGNSLVRRSKFCDTDKAILQINIDGTIVKEWSKSRDITRELGYSQSSIMECCRGIRNKAYGYKWQFAI